MLKRLGIVVLVVLLLTTMLPVGAYAKTINIPVPQSLTISPENITLNVGESKPFNAFVTFSDGSIRDVSRNAVFSISNGKIIRVNNGQITALSPGAASVLVRSYGKMGVIQVIVRGAGAEAKQPTRVVVPEKKPQNVANPMEEKLEIEPADKAQTNSPETPVVIPVTSTGYGGNDEVDKSPTVVRPEPAPKVNPELIEQTPPAPKKAIPQPVNLEVTPADINIQPGQSKEFQAKLTFSDDSVRDVTRDAVFVISDKSIVSVGNGRITALKPGAATIAMRSYGKTARIKVTVQEAAPEPQKNSIPRPVSIAVTPTEITLQKGQSRQFEATLTFSDGSIRDVTRNAVFTISDKNIVSVGNGVITGLAPGTANIDLRSYGLTARINVTVTGIEPPKFEIPKPVRLEVTPREVSLQPGQSQQFNATLTFSDGTTRDVTRNAVFIISNKSIVSVGNGQITALSPGEATIDVRTYGLTTRINVLVKERPKFEIPRPVSLTVNPTDITLNPGQSQLLQATLMFSDGSTRDVSRNAVWFISDSRVVTVGNGAIKALNPGTATIIMRTYGLTARINVVVKEDVSQVPQPVRITVIPDNLTLQVGQTEQAKALLTFSDNTTKDIGREATWSTNDSGVVTVEDGRITALAPGTATVTVKSHNLAASIQVTVKEQKIPPDTTRVFTWNYDGKTYEQEIQVPATLLDWSKNVKETTKKFYESAPYTQYQMLKNIPQDVKQLVLAVSSNAKGNLTPWVKEPQNLDYINGLAQALKAKAQAAGYDRFQTAEFALSFVQSIPYEADIYPQLPAQTLVENGDCDDRSILLAAILKNMGYDVALLDYINDKHMNLGISFTGKEVPKRNYVVRYYEYQGKNYYLAETTNHDPIGMGPTFRATGIFPVN